MSKLALILFLLIIIAYVISYLRFNAQHFQSSIITKEQLEMALSFFNGLKYENNTFSIYDKPIISQIKGVFRLGMWKLEDNVNSITTYLNFLSNGKVHSFDTKESDILATDTYKVSPSATNLDFNYGEQSYNFEYVNEDKYKLVGSNNIHLTKLKEFTIKTSCSAKKGSGCQNLNQEKSLFYLNDIQYKISYTNEKTQISYKDYGAQGGLEELYGMHILVLNSNGSIYDFKHYDLFKNAEHYLEAKLFIKDIPSGNIVAVNTYGDIARMGYPRIELYDTNNTLKITHRLDTMTKHIDLTTPTNIEDYHDLFVEGGTQPIKKLHMSPGIKFTLYKDSVPSEGNPGENLGSEDILGFSSDFQGKTQENLRIFNLQSNQQQNFKSIKLTYNFESNENKANILIKDLRNPIEALMKIGDKYGIRLDDISSYTIIGVKDEPINNAARTLKTPNYKFDCPNNFKNIFTSIGENINTEISRDFILKAYKPIPTSFKVDVFSKGLHYFNSEYDSHGFSAFYVNDKYIDLEYISRGINVLVLNEDGTTYDFKGFDTHTYDHEDNLEDLLVFYEGIPQSKIVCISFVDSSIKGAVQKAALYNDSSQFGTVLYVSQGEYMNNGIYTSTYTDGFQPNIDANYEDKDMTGFVEPNTPTDSVFVYKRTKLELYSGSQLDGSKTTITSSQLSSSNNLYTFSTPQNFDSIKVVPDKDNYDFVDIYDIIKDLGGPNDIGLNTRCNFALIGKKGGIPNSASYSFQGNEILTTVYGEKTVGSPIDSLAHASKSFDLLN